MNLLIFLIWSSFFGCQTVPAELAEAKRLEEAGQLSQAFDLYIQLEKQYPGNSVSSNPASKALQRIYLNYAKEQEEIDPEKAIQVYQKMLERWPQDTIAVVVEKKIDKLKVEPEKKNSAPSKSSSMVEQEPGQNEDQIFCEKARDAASRIVWQQYKQQYPAGSCLEEANYFLQGTKPRDSELEEIRTLVNKCQIVLQSACQEYNLSKTTSDATACKHANRAFSNELQRLIRRKRALLADGNEDYYQKFIPKRWNSVKSGIHSACQETQDFLAEKDRLGVDLAPFTEIVSGQCNICLESFGDIEKL